MFVEAGDDMGLAELTKWLPGEGCSEGPLNTRATCRWIKTRLSGEIVTPTERGAPKDLNCRVRVIGNHLTYSYYRVRKFHHHYMVLPNAVVAHLVLPLPTLIELGRYKWTIITVAYFTLLYPPHGSESINHP